MNNNEEFKLEKTSMWSFPNRGNWSVHNGSYRGNWTPYVPKNIIMRYCKKNSWVLDQFAGSGTTVTEALLLGRNIIGLDLNENALNIIKDNISKLEYDTRALIKKCDATNISFIKSGKIDLICTHPPYLDIIKYSNNKNDFSNMTLKTFKHNMTLVAKESYRVLKKDGICAFMIGDVRKNGVIIPLGMETLNIFINQSFKVKEIIIKKQHNCKMTKYWENKNPSFLILAHEYIFVLQK
ncbi:TRM11 family SAM-dependent methyltransferase [Peptostreptococcus anaerobius]|uniref:TRM11 family SAM-dependent methyltransferase n=1 Tax=Peptostreptococcus anaerobius TaxID=1261 RepID=UPI00321B92F7